MSGHGHSSHGGHAEHSNAKYLYVFLTLCVLTGASFFTYSDYWPYKETPAVGWAFMMAVSVTKAMLVILFFMHLLYEASWKYVLTIPAGIMSVFLVLALIPDIGLRARHFDDVTVQFTASPADEAALVQDEKSLEHEDH